MTDTNNVDTIDDGQTSEHGDATGIGSRDDMSDSLSLTRRELLAESAGVDLGLGTLDMSAGRTKADIAAEAGKPTTVAAGHLHAEFNDANGLHLQSLYDNIG